jgi:NTE family protein
MTDRTQRDQEVRGLKTIALALGAGGARGIAHIHVLGAFDDLGVKPLVISGTSIGALMGAAYGPGMSGEEIEDHLTNSFSWPPKHLKSGPTE